MLVGEVFARMGLDSKQYEKDLSRLEGVTRREATTLGAVFKNAFSVALGIGVFEAVKRGFQTITGTAIGFNAQMEMARIGFTTMLGSAERAEAFLRDMADFAARTPFEFPELLDASKRMLAYGFAAEDVLPTMEAVGNASAAVGLGTEGINRIILALGQMRAKGKLSAEEMRQLTETGIPAWEILAEAMNKTTAEIMDMQQKGLIPADRAIKMLVEGMNKRFPNMMAQMEDTWEGVTSTIKDVWQMTIGDVTKNLFQGVVSWLQKVRDFAVGFYDTFQKYGLQRAISESFGPEVAALVSVLGAIMRGFGTVVRTVTGLITRYGKQIKFVTVVMGTYLAITKAVTLAKQLMITVTAIERGQLLAKIPILNVVSTAMGIYRVQMALAAQQGVVLTGVIARLRVALYSLWSALGPIGWIILGLSAAVGVGTHLWGKYTQSVYGGTTAHQELAEGAELAGGSAGDAVGAIEDEADALKKAGKAANKNLQSFDEVHTLQEDMAGSAEDLAESMGFDDTELGAPEAGGLEIPDIGAQLEEMKPTLAGFWEWIKQGAGNLWESVKQKWSDFVNWVKSWAVWDWLAQKWSGLKNISQVYWTGMIDVISTAWKGIGNVTQTAWQEVWKLLQTYWNNAAKLATDVFVAIWDYIKGTWNNIKSSTSNIWGDIWGFLKNQWETIKTFGGNIFGILGDLITGKIDLRAAVKQIWNETKNFFFSTWTNISTFGTNIWTSLRDFFINQWSLIQGVAIAIWTAIKDFFIGNWEATKEAASNIWTAIKDFFSQTWEAIKNAVVEYWTAILEFLGINWETTKQKASEIWTGIKDTITDLIMGVRDKIVEIWSRTKDTLVDLWDNIKRSAQDKWDGVRTVIKGAVNGIIGFINKFIKAWNKIELKVPEVKIPLVGTVGGWTVRVPRIPEIPMLAKGGLVMDPTLAMLGEAGPEAVIPLGRSGFAGDLADTVAQAVYQAIMDAIRIAQASSQQSDDRELVLKIDNTVLARMQLPAIISEGQRQGLNLVVQPQGV